MLGGTIQYFGLDHPCKFFGVHEIKTCFFKRCYQEENFIQKGVHQKQYFFKKEFIKHKTFFKMCASRTKKTLKKVMSEANTAGQ